MYLIVPFNTECTGAATGDFQHVFGRCRRVIRRAAPGGGTDVVPAHAKYLARHSDQRVRLEGHTDERGSREYNIGLGERRAQSVRRALLLQGATDAQISTVSYGEERPKFDNSREESITLHREIRLLENWLGVRLFLLVSKRNLYADISAYLALLFELYLLNGWCVGPYRLAIWHA